MEPPRVAKITRNCKLRSCHIPTQTGQAVSLWYRSTENRQFQEMEAAIALCSQKSTLLQNPVYLKDPNSSFPGGSLKCLSSQLKLRNKRRDAVSSVVASASLTTATTTTTNGGGRFYFNFTGFPFPLGPFLNRRTIRTEVSLFNFKLDLKLQAVSVFFFHVLIFLGHPHVQFLFENFFGFEKSLISKGEVKLELQGTSSFFLL